MSESAYWIMSEIWVWSKSNLSPELLPIVKSRVCILPKMVKWQLPEETDKNNKLLNQLFMTTNRYFIRSAVD